MMFIIQLEKDMKFSFTVFCMLLAFPALATYPPGPVATSGSGSEANSAASAVGVGVSESKSAAVSEAVSGSKSSSVVGDTASASNSTASVGDTIAAGGSALSLSAGGDASASQTANGGNASNLGNAQSVNVSHSGVRNAPSVAQGALITSGCGFGGNAGGSNVNGAGFLGISFTTNECYLYMLAQSFSAIGMPDTACDVLLSTRSARHAFKGKALPDCTMIRNRPSVVAVDQGLATKEYVNEVTDRVLKRSLSK
jgi:hypothetical protein